MSDYIVHRRKNRADKVIGELVRCKECIWRDRDNQGEEYCTYAKGLADINESSFCSWGERTNGQTLNLVDE